MIYRRQGIFQAPPCLIHIYTGPWANSVSPHLLPPLFFPSHSFRFSLSLLSRVDPRLSIPLSIYRGAFVLDFSVDVHGANFLHADHPL